MSEYAPKSDSTIRFDGKVMLPTQYECTGLLDYNKRQLRVMQFDEKDNLYFFYDKSGSRVDISHDDVMGFIDHFSRFMREANCGFACSKRQCCSCRLSKGVPDSYSLDFVYSTFKKNETKTLEFGLLSKYSLESEIIATIELYISGRMDHLLEHNQYFTHRKITDSEIPVIQKDLLEKYKPQLETIIREIVVNNNPEFDALKRDYAYGNDVPELNLLSRI
jgi:hypothetical protein